MPFPDIDDDDDEMDVPLALRWTFGSLPTPGR
jgi:hypothetical protein